jgi:multidrug resistance efflux pump
MAEVEIKSKGEAAGRAHTAIGPPEAAARHTTRPRIRILPLSMTLATIALAVALGRTMWNAYMGAPWTRDGRVRAYVVTIAPEVAGRIVELPVVDNQLVHKGDSLMVVRPDQLPDRRESR